MDYIELIKKFVGREISIKEFEMDYIELLKKFVSGEISIKEFEQVYFSDEGLQQYLQEKLPESMVGYAQVRWNNGDINLALRKEKWNTKRGRFVVQILIHIWLQGNAIECEATPVYHEESSFLIGVMPDYINGEQAEALVDEIIQSVPETMPKTKRIKEIKAKIKEAFHLEDRKYPRWAQDTDWPFSKTGKPLKYVSQKTDGDLVKLKFIDVDTGEETIVEDFY